MPKIKRLSKHEAQKIAAGEVVERPANVVKELIENSIDAKATSISVYLKDGGKKLIRIVDNGCGMSPADAALCFEQHATSKITTVDDLDTIGTFGFRGEALASIASVSEIILITKEIESTDSAGLQLELKSGTTVQEGPCPCPVGTDISIKNLFFNLPARQKFLKKKETESRHINQLMHAFCLDHLEIHFKFFQEGREVINAPATDNIISRVAQLWDHNFAKQMIPIKADGKNGTHISGAISNHQYFRYDRNNLFFFVNKRWIKDIPLSRALLRGYQNVLPPARFPAACIFVEIDQSHVDVNIHPRKEEVQFLHPRTITTLLQSAVKETLENHLSSQLRTEVKFATTEKTLATENKPYSFEPRPVETRSVESRFAESRSAGPRPAFIQPSSGKPFGLDAALSKNPFTTNSISQNTQAIPKFEQVANNKIEKEHQSSIEVLNTTNDTQINQAGNFKIIGQYKKTYILLEKEDGLFLVDQHAAHERILYEIFATKFQDIATVKLMFPQTINLCEEDMETITPHLNILKKNGIEIEPFGAQQLVVQSTPVHIKNINLEQLVKQVSAWIRKFDGLDEQQFFKAINEKMHAQMACKAAVKAGDALTQEQMEKLLSDLQKTNNRLTCPHGRPTGWLLSLYEIEKKFKRKN